MRPKRLLWQLYPSYLLITLAALFAATWYTSALLRDSHYNRTQAALESRARLLVEQMRGPVHRDDGDSVDALCDRLGASARIRITIITPSGLVLGDSEKDPATMENHADRPEIIEAYQGQVGASRRFSDTLQQDMMYVAVPLYEADDLLGVVRTSLSLQAIEETLGTIRLRIAWGAVLIAVLAAVVSLYVSNRISHPLREMRLGARRFAQGELGHRLPVPGSEEMAALAEALNQMAAQLDERIRTVVRERNEKEAILASMIEGVLAVDTDELVISLNEAAGGLLGVDPEQARGRPIVEVVRSSELHAFIGRALESEAVCEGDVALRTQPERLLQARGTLLRGVDGRHIGALIVLNDVTRVRRLERMRRDFIANVSHELKTPVTTVKGYVETLRDSPPTDREDARRFVQVIAEHVDRLNAIIEDLLALCRIEEDAETSRLNRVPTPLLSALEEAVRACRAKAEGKQIRIELDCPEGLTASLNPRLATQAVVNLIDNAVQYSDPGAVVEVEGIEEDDGVAIRVHDHGCGIARKHMPRIFERFYRVDKARSRSLGGTGLGLAIVKHIAQSHGGSVEAESAPGEGSTFTIRLPAD